MSCQSISQCQHLQLIQTKLHRTCQVLNQFQFSFCYTHNPFRCSFFFSLTPFWDFLSSKSNTERNEKLDIVVNWMFDRRSGVIKNVWKTTNNYWKPGKNREKDRKFSNLTRLIHCIIYSIKCTWSRHSSHWLNFELVDKQNVFRILKANSKFWEKKFKTAKCYKFEIVNNRGYYLNEWQWQQRVTPFEIICISVSISFLWLCSALYVHIHQFQKF